MKDKRRRGGLPRNRKLPQAGKNQPRQEPHEREEEEPGRSRRSPSEEDVWSEVLGDQPVLRFNALQKEYPAGVPMDKVVEFLKGEDRRLRRLPREERAQKAGRAYLLLVTYLKAIYGDALAEPLVIHAPYVTGLLTGVDPEEEALRQSARIERLITYILELRGVRECRFVGDAWEGIHLVRLPAALFREDRANARRNLKECMEQASEGEGNLDLLWKDQSTGVVTHSLFFFTPYEIMKCPAEDLRQLFEEKTQSGGVPGHSTRYEEADVDLS